MLPQRIHRHSLLCLYRGAPQRAEVVPKANIDFRLGELTSLYGAQHFPRRIEAGIRHFQRGAALYAPNGIVRAAPVRHDHAVKPPLVPQNVKHELRVFIRLKPVYLVIACHQRSRPSLFHRNLKTGEIEFPERSLVHDGI